MALERNPGVVAAMREAEWEIASHGYRWIDYQGVDVNTEREHLAKAIDIHTRVTGERPLGWYLGRCSPQSHRLAAEEGGFTYNADCYADDVPYWDYAYATPQLMVPYTLDANDMRFTTAQGFNSGQQFFSSTTLPVTMMSGLRAVLISRTTGANIFRRSHDEVGPH